MIGFLIGALLAYFFVQTIRFLHAVDNKQREEFKAKQEQVNNEPEEDYALVGRADRPRPKGKHCPLHNWSYNELTHQNICTWCNKTPTQIFAENGGGRE